MNALALYFLMEKNAARERANAAEREAENVRALLGAEASREFMENIRDERDEARGWKASVPRAENP